MAPDGARPASWSRARDARHDQTKPTSLVHEIRWRDHNISTPPPHRGLSKFILLFLVCFTFHTILSLTSLVSEIQLHFPEQGSSHRRSPTVRCPSRRSRYSRQPVPPPHTLGLRGGTHYPRTQKLTPYEPTAQATRAGMAGSCLFRTHLVRGPFCHRTHLDRFQVSPPRETRIEGKDGRNLARAWCTLCSLLSARHSTTSKF